MSHFRLYLTLRMLSIVRMLIAMAVLVHYFKSNVQSNAQIKLILLYFSNKSRANKLWGAWRVAAKIISTQN